ncbi:hypothetical protein VTK56DRAFT_5418 [Thermocarpiscus australiensis]
MLPSRGSFRPAPALRLARAALQKPSTPALSRQFGTALRGYDGSALHRKLKTTRIGPPLAHTTTSQQPVFSVRQHRYASTQLAPLSSTAPADASTLADVTATPVSLTGSDLLDIPEQIGFLKALGLEYGFGPTSLMQTLLESIYVYTGLPWWASIGLVALTVKLVLLKPAIDASENAQKMQDLQKDPRYRAAEAEMKAQLLTGNNLAMAEARLKTRRMQQKVGFKLWKNFVPMIQVPLGIGMYRVIRGMAALPVPSFETGGVLWFTDLAVADPYFVLPIVTGILMTVAMRIPIPYMSPQQQNMMKTFNLIMFPLSTVFTVFLPAGVQFYFLVTSALQLLQSYVLYQNSFRRWVGLRPLFKTAAESGDMSWQPPRVLDQHAPRVKTSQAAAPQSESMFASFRSTIDMAKAKFNDYSDKNDKDYAQKRAREYEEKRALEEKERIIARLQEKKRAKDSGYQ